MTFSTDLIIYERSRKRKWTLGKVRHLRMGTVYITASIGCRSIVIWTPQTVFAWKCFV